MRFLQAFSYGTGRYPPKVARRLCILNLACWNAGPIWLGFSAAWWIFAAVPSSDIKLRLAVAISSAAGMIIIATPLLHRFGELAAGVAFMSVSFVATFAICLLGGTDTGMNIHFLAYAAGAVLVFGVDPIKPSLIVAAAALAFIVAVRSLAPHDGGLLSERALLINFIVGVSSNLSIVFAVVFYAVRELTRAEAEVELEYDRSESLLTNILPSAIAHRLKSHADQVLADRHDEASILFADMAGFTAEASATSPIDLVKFLNDVFSAFDRLVEGHGLEKIKTTGDSYMVVSGVPAPRPDHAAALARFALDLLDAARGLRDPHGRDVSIRIGMASGPVVAGVVGRRKFFYDVWGDAVNVASRMESTGVPGRIQVAPETYQDLKDLFHLECRGPIQVKGKGEMTTWFLMGPKGLCS